MKPRHQHQIVIARQLFFNRRVSKWCEAKSVGRYGRVLECPTKQLQFQLIWYSRLNRNIVGVLRQRRNHYCAQVRGFLIRANNLKNRVLQDEIVESQQVGQRTDGHPHTSNGLTRAGANLQSSGSTSNSRPSTITKTLSRFIKCINCRWDSPKTTSQGTSSHPESGPLCEQPRCRHAQRLLRSRILAQVLHWRQFWHCDQYTRSCPALHHQ